MPEKLFFLVSLLPAVATAQTQHTVVPAAYATLDANSHLRVAGASSDVRQQTLIGSSHLTSLVGRAITAIELRRSAGPDAFDGALADLSLTLSTSPNTPLSCARTFAQNIGADAITVFQGAVQVPASTATTGPSMSWAATGVVRIVLHTPFAYHGGTLCIDLTGIARAGQQSSWWSADAVQESISGTAVSTGAGCGAFVNAQGESSFVAAQSLLPGGEARFSAFGPVGNLGLLVFGSLGQQSIPLSMLGIPAPGCDVHLAPAGILATAVSFFAPETLAGLPGGRGEAIAYLGIPNASWTLGTQMATQWVDLNQPATSNAVLRTIAASVPTLDMALVEGHPLETEGTLSLNLAHVMRFEFQ